jgi:surface-anchored protein
MYRFSICVFGLFAFIALPVSCFSVEVYLMEGHGDVQLGSVDSLGLNFFGHGGSGGSIIDGSLLGSDTYYSFTDIAITVPDTTKNYFQSLGGATSDIAAKLGIDSGDDYWLLPQSSLGDGSAPALRAPFLGLGTESMNEGVFLNDAVNLTLLDMTGPTGGQFALQRSATWLMSTFDGIGEGDVVPNFPIPYHGHYKWYFSKPGFYNLTLQSSATRIGTDILETDIQTVTFLVGTTVWKGTNGSNWNDVGNWVSGYTTQSTIVSGVPSYGSTVVFTSSTDPNQPLAQDIAAPLDLHGIVFTANAGSYQLGGQTIRLSVDSPEITSESASDQEIANPLDLAADATFAVNGLGHVALSGPISGSGGFAKTGSGTLVLANAATHNGDTVIADGILALADSGQIENSAIVNDATFQIMAGDHSVTAISGNGATTVLAGSLTADSIVQNTLTIAAGARITIAPLPGVPLGNCLTPVPEPSSSILLACAMISLLMICFRRRNPQP